MKYLELEGKIEFTEQECKKHNRSFSASIEKSSAFCYGNQTCVIIRFDDSIYEDKYIDTRYDMTLKKTPESFKKWLLEFFKNNYRANKITFLD